MSRRFQEPNRQEHPGGGDLRKTCLIGPPPRLCTGCSYLLLYLQDHSSSAAQATAASAPSCCGTGPSRRPPSAMNSEPVEKLASSEATNSTIRVISSGSAMRGIADNPTPAPAIVAAIAAASGA